jgi:signal transduction histidine kinase
MTPRTLLRWLALFTAIGLLNASHFYLSGMASHHAGENLTPILIEELTGAWSVGLLLPMLIAMTRRIRRIGRWLPRYAAHLVLLLAFSAAHTSLMWGSRLLAFPLFGLGHYDYGRMGWRYPMELASDVLAYALVTSIIWLLDHYRASRDRELRAAQLESALADARLEALRLQLNPHFLFNALNAVSAAMYEQPRAADEMLARIGDLLRATLGAGAQEHPLAEELRLLELYLDIQRARFGEHLQVQLEIAPGLAAARVPFLVLQPLVENAIEHAGGAARHVEIRATATAGTVALQVRDHGGPAGSAPRRGGHGIGLGNTEARLRHLYGEAAGLALETAGDGTLARLWLPLRTEATA